MSNTIRMTESIRESSAASTGVRGRRFSGSSTAKSGSSGWMTSGGNTLQRLVESEAEKKMKPVTEETPSDRSEAAKVYEAAIKGSKNILSNIRTAPKVPYGYLAKDNVITYNGVVFTCDEIGRARLNSSHIH